MKNAMLFLILLMIVPVGNVNGADSPRFRGPDGDGIFPETGLLKQWPDGGPKLAWSVTGLGQGFSSAAVVDGTIYVTGMDNQKQGYLFAFNPNGSPKWKVPYGPEMDRTGPAVAGTRGTPTIDGDMIFVMSSFATLYTLEAKTGQMLRSERQ